VGVAAAVTIAVTLLLGIIGTTFGLLRAKNETANAKKETERATQEANKAKAVTEFVQEMLAAADPIKNSRSDITVGQIIDEAARKLDSGTLNEQPGVESGVRLTLGVTYAGLGKSNQADFQLRKSLALAEKVYGPESSEVASVLGSLGMNILSQGRHLAAIDLMRRSLKIRQNLFGNNSPEVVKSLTNLGTALNRHYRDNAAAESYLREALRVCRERHDDKLAAPVLRNLGNVLREGRQLPEALAMNREALNLYRKYEGEDSFGASNSWVGVANTFLWKGDLQGCDEALTRGLDIQRKILTIKHPTMQFNLLWLAEVRLRRRQYAQAAELLLELHNSLMQPYKDDPERENEAAVAARLAHLYNSWGNQQETEHWAGVWVKLMEARVATRSVQIAAKKEDAKLFRSRAIMYSSLGELDKASSDLAVAIHLDPLENSQWLQRSCLLAYMKDARGYKDHCRLMFERLSYRCTDKADQRWARQCAAKGCLLMPEAPVELKQITDAIDSTAVAAVDLPWYQVNKGLAEYRLGHYQQAIDWSTKAREGNYEQEGEIEPNLVIAMASYKLGRNDQARLALAKAADQIEKDLPHLRIGDISDADVWVNFADGWLICQILLREANDLIPVQKPTTLVSP